MRFLSLKGKLTLLYTVLMTTVVCAVLGLLFSLSEREILSSVQARLQNRVTGAVDDIEYSGGGLDFDSDLMSLEHGVYLSVYDRDGFLLYGKVPYGFDNSARFEDGTVREFDSAGVHYYVMDLFYQAGGYEWIVIRGVVSATDAEEGFFATVRLAVILLPLMVLLTAVMAYLMARRTLRPVRTITETVRQIQKDGDLSRRIHLGSGKDEIYRMASTFDDMLEQVEAAVKREQQFTSDVSHELRTPVAAMILQCEELLQTESEDPGTRQGIELLNRKARYLSNMISQLLYLSRADQGRERLHLEVLDFSELTRFVCEEAEAAAEGERCRKSISLDARIAPDIFLRGDATLLIRFWMNLLNNAAAYGKENGHIWVSLHREGNRAAGMVRDDGIGISQEDLPHIWERFFQADSSRTREDSSGLGLSMVAWIVQAHGGEITAKSRLGEGTEFSFSFPLAEEEKTENIRR